MDKTGLFHDRCVRFWKMSGAGNDFIVVGDMENSIPDELLGVYARELCDRRFGVGADGLMVVRPARADGDFKMLFYNSDGSAAEMCGNGARCVCRYGYENGLAGQTQRVETPSGTVTGWRRSDTVYTVRLNDPTVVKTCVPAEGDGATYACFYVELGSPGLPHAAVEVPRLASMGEDELRRLGRALRYHPVFPKGANVTFFAFSPDQGLCARTYERGVEDFTLACGTGAASLVTALTELGRVDGWDVAVSMPGGTLHVTVERDGDGAFRQLLLTGPTKVICRGMAANEMWADGGGRE